MNKIIKSCQDNISCSDMLQQLYGISSAEHFDCVFIAPSWPIDKVFDSATTDIAEIYSDRFSKSHRIKHNGKSYLYIQLQVGAPNIVDFCLSCHSANCAKFVFVGSVGSLVPELEIGDVIIPTCSISGNGATLYLDDKLSPEKMFERTYSSPELNAELSRVCTNVGMSTKEAAPISVDSIACEYAHLDEFRQMGATLIEMETATFFKAMQIIGKPASALLVVSDNSAVGQHLFGQGADLRAKYHAVRSRIKDVLLNL